MARIRPVGRERAGELEPAPAAADELGLADLLRLRELHDGSGWHLAVLDGDREVGRLALVPGAWLWRLPDGRSGYAESRAAALQALAAAWDSRGDV